MSAKRIKPPSKTGIGSRFVKKSEMLMSARNSSVETTPSLNPAANPCFTVVPKIEVILTGPETAFVRLTPLNKIFMLFPVNAIIFALCVNPSLHAPKNPCFGYSCATTDSGSETIPSFPAPVSI